MRVIFMGTPDFAVPSLSEIVGQGHEVAAVYTRAPASGGRGMALRPSPVHAMADRLGLAVLTPKSLKGDPEAEAFAAHGADVAVVVAYGLILPRRILDAPRLGCLNLHGSLLPRWRGAAPIQRAVMAGDGQSGVMVMRMEAGLDTGPVGMAESVAIGPDMTAGDLHDRLAPIGADLMGRALAALGRGTLTFRAQAEEGVTYAHKIDKAECRIDWARPAAAVHDLIRGVSPFPGAFFEADLGNGVERVKVLRARLGEGEGSPGTLIDDVRIACGTGSVLPTLVQRAGKAPWIGPLSFGARASFQGLGSRTKPDSVPRYKLTIEYDGTPFVGWQRQANGASVQGELERAALALAGGAAAIRGAGRTDAGVHATGQVAHLDLPKPYRTDSVRDALNAELRPWPITVLAAELVADDFDARRSATQRHYLYRIVNRRMPLALTANRAWLVKRPLDASAMHEAAQVLIGRHDFSTFRDTECQAASPVRTLDALRVARSGEAIDIEVSARSFLHRQVRSMVGSIERVGAGQWAADDLRDALEARDRSRCGTVAPAVGLYLVRVDY